MWNNSIYRISFYPPYVTTYTANNSQIYNKKDIRKGRNSSITIILPISIGKHPQFFTSFDFIIKKVN